MKNIFKFLSGKNRKVDKIDKFEIIDADSQKSLLQFNPADNNLNIEEWIQIPQRYSDKLDQYNKFLQFHDLHRWGYFSN